jgi:hypothetical protein
MPRCAARPGGLKLRSTYSESHLRRVQKYGKAPAMLGVHEGWLSSDAGHA